MKSNILVIGSINYDILLFQERLPQIGETYFATDVKLLCGGKGANQAVQCAKLGLPTKFLGKIGNDSLGETCLNNLNKYGVDTTHVQKSNDKATGLGIVTNFPDGYLISTISKGSNFSLNIEDVEEIKNLINDSFAIILQLEIPMDVVESIISYAAEVGTKIILNGAPAIDISDELLKKIDYFIVNESEAAFYSDYGETNIENVKEIALKLSDKIKGTIVVTLGVHGSITYHDNEFIFEPAKKVSVVDTTGAGDSYIGALAYGLSKRWEMKDILKFATKVSSITVQGYGGQDAMPFLSDINI